jgi:hypothetical protein
MLQSKVPPDVRNQIRQQLAGEIGLLQRRLLSRADPQPIIAALAEALVMLSKGADEHKTGSKSVGFQVQLTASIAFFRQIGASEEVLEPLVHGQSEFLDRHMGRMPGGLFQDRRHRSPASDLGILKVCLWAALEILLLMGIRPISNALKRVEKNCPEPMRALPLKRRKGKLSVPTARLEELRNKIGNRSYFLEGTKEAVFLAKVRARLAALDGLTNANHVLEREYQQMLASAQKHLHRIPSR